MRLVKKLLVTTLVVLFCFATALAEGPKVELQKTTKMDDFPVYETILEVVIGDSGGVLVESDVMIETFDFTGAIPEEMWLESDTSVGIRDEPGETVGLYLTTSDSPKVVVLDLAAPEDEAANTEPDQVNTSGDDNRYETGVILTKGVVDGEGMVPAEVTHIGRYAFFEQWWMESITLPEGLLEIEESAFEYCSSLKTVTIPEGVVRIGDYAFANCSALEVIIIPESVTSIGSGCFYDTEVVIYGLEGSFADIYADDNLIEFVALEE